MVFSKREMDTIKESINIAMGKTANALSEIFNDLVLIDVPEIIVERVERAKEFLKNKYKRFHSIHQSFLGGVEGKIYVLFPESSLNNLVKILSGEEKIDKDFLDDILLELGNILTNNIIGAIGEFLNVRIEYTLPEGGEVNFSELQAGDDYYVVIINSILKLKSKNIKINFLIVFTIKAFDKFKSLFSEVINNES